MENQGKYPVENRVYDLMQAFVSKCEAIEAYSKYVKDGNAHVFEKLIEDERKHADVLLGELKQAFRTV